MVEFHVQVVRYGMRRIHCLGKDRSEPGQSTHGGEIYGGRRIQYIIWDRSGQSTHGGYPCTGEEMYSGRRIHSLG